MPKKRQSQPMQVWLGDSDRQRLAETSRKTGCSKSQLAREAIQLMLDQIEDRARARAAFAASGLSFEQYTLEARRIIGRAEDEAWSTGFNKISGGHLLLSLIKDPATARFFERAGIRYAAARNRSLSFSGFGSDTIFDATTLSLDAEQCLRRSKRIAHEYRDEMIDALDLLLAVLDQRRGGAYDVLEVLGVDLEQLINSVKNEKPVTPVRRRKRKS